MEKGPEIPSRRGFWRVVVGAWLALARRKIRLLQGGEITAEGPVLFAVSHPPGFLHALALAVAIQRPVHCLLPKNLASRMPARFLARRFHMILEEGEKSPSEAAWGEAVDVLAGGGALLVFADQNSPGQGTPASTAALLVARAEAQQAGRRVAVHPVHLFLPESIPSSREILIYVDAVVARPRDQPATPGQDAETPALAAALEARFQENAFQLRPADVKYFLADLEEVLRADLQEDWASRPDWKQDTEGFVLSRMVAEWVKETNYLNPGRLVALRKSLDDYRHLQQQCALRELEVEGGDSALGVGWRRALLWAETLLGLPIALYGLLNHLAIILVLFLAGSFRRNSSRAPNTEWTIRAAVTLGFYILQIYLVAHWRGRAWAGYYAPTLPVSGAYLWRYVGLVRPQARLLFMSATIPGLIRKIDRLRHALMADLDQTLTSYEEKTRVPR
jgi:nucleotide-binding universal stress UspA family protein